MAYDNELNNQEIARLNGACDEPDYYLEQYKISYTKEPIPKITEKRLGSLKSIISRAFSGFEDECRYPEVEKRAYYLLNTIIRNHPLENGNKRVAVLIFIHYLNIKNYYKITKIDKYLNLFQCNDSEFLKNIAQNKDGFKELFSNYK